MQACRKSCTQASPSLRRRAAASMRQPLARPWRRCARPAALPIRPQMPDSGPGLRAPRGTCSCMASSCQLGAFGSRPAVRRTPATHAVPAQARFKLHARHNGMAASFPPADLCGRAVGGALRQQRPLAHGRPGLWPAAVAPVRAVLWWAPFPLLLFTRSPGHLRSATV